MTDDRRAVLEGIAFGDDPKLNPADRLRALELLAQMADTRRSGVYDLSHLSGEELDRELADLLEPLKTPTLRRMLAKAVQERMRHLDAEVERRASEIAFERYAKGPIRQALEHPQ